MEKADQVNNQEKAGEYKIFLKIKSHWKQEGLPYNDKKGQCTTELS